jgi:large subunit ribosomal protein L18
MNRKNQTEKRTRRHKRIRAKVVGTSERPRLSVYKSNRYVHAQLVNDAKGETIAGFSSVSDNAGKASKVVQARALGETLAKKAAKLRVASVVFDRGGFKYTGRVRAFAEGARQGGLKF